MPKKNRSLLSKYILRKFREKNIQCRQSVYVCFAMGCLLFLQRVANFSVLLAGPGILFQVSAVQNQGEIQRRQSERQFITLSLETVAPGNSVHGFPQLL